MKLGKLTALWLCWELWDWLAKNPDKLKSSWSKWKRNGGKLSAFKDCFACKYMMQRNYTGESLFAAKCHHVKNPCIIPCFGGKYVGCSRGGLFTQYNQTKNQQRRYARIIANSAYVEYKRLGGKKCK